MLKAGLDFGTTYSAVCIYDDVTQKMDYLKFDHCAREFFPTVIAYSKDDPTRRYIGDAGRRYRLSPKYDGYDLFKLSMGDEAYEANGRRRTPFEAAQDFIREVLEKIRQNKGAAPEEIVLVQSVPDVWKNSVRDIAALEHLTELYDGLGLDTDSRVSFESEPVSAAAYYVNEICRGGYSGYIVVVDYGGGTLDLTLCRAEKNGTISVLGSCGDAGNAQKGCAGSAFDREVTLRLTEKYGLDENIYQPGMPAFSMLQNAFEDCKIASTESTRRALNDYYESGGIDDPVAFSVMMPPPMYDEYEVRASDIAQSFEKINEPALRKAVNDMEQICRVQGVDTGSIDEFRVLLVGGFSNLHCVENSVREMFGSTAGVADPRFDERMNRESRSTAIAHGACLIAAGITPVEYINQTEMGFYAINTRGEEFPALVLLRGKPVKEYAQAQYYPHKIMRAFHGMPIRLELYFNGGAGAVKIRMDELFADLCPDEPEGNNEYYIGFSIDRHRIPQLHIRNAVGNVKTKSLYEIVSKLPALIIPEDQKEEDAE